MGDSGRVFATALWSVFALSAVSGCYSTAPKTAPAPAHRAPPLVALPATATIAWVRPSVLIADATSEDDENASLGSVRGMRADVETVLKGERWHVVDSDTAQYLATITIAKRTTYQPERRVVPGTEFPSRTCDATTGACRGAPTPPPQYQTVSVPVTTERVVFVIVRRQDGARHAYGTGFLNAASSGGLFAQQVITLLRAR
jgi:hypothetical protein